MFDIELTKHLAELSKINFNDDELNKMNSDMADIISLMDKVCEFDNSQNTHTLAAVDYNNLREDNYSASFPVEKILQNAKNVKNNSFTVPKVV